MLFCCVGFFVVLFYYHLFKVSAIVYICSGCVSWYQSNLIHTGMQISFAAALSSLSDRSRFKGYFRTTPTFNNYAPALVALLNNFKWKRIAFITEVQTLFVKVNIMTCCTIETCIYVNVFNSMNNVIMHCTNNSSHLASRNYRSPRHYSTYYCS